MLECKWYPKTKIPNFDLVWSCFMTILGPSVSAYFNSVTMMRQDNNLFVCFWASHLEWGNPLAFDCPYKNLMLKNVENKVSLVMIGLSLLITIVATVNYGEVGGPATACIFVKSWYPAKFLWNRLSVAAWSSRMMVNGSCRYLDKNMQNLW